MDKRTTRAFTPSPLDYQVEHPVDARAILAEQLAQSNQVLRECWRTQRDNSLEYRMQVETLKIAARLMKINLKQCEALAGRPREFVHRIIVERAPDGTFARAQPHTVDAFDSAMDVTPPPPSKILKTIHGVASPLDPQDVEAGA